MRFVLFMQHLELSKALKRIFQKEKQLEELKKELQGSELKKAKLQKQVIIECLELTSGHDRCTCLHQVLCNCTSSRLKVLTRRETMLRLSLLKQNLAV